LPDLLFVVDVKREETSVKEANILGIPVLGLVDTNCDPSVIDHVIPSNDDAIRAIKLMVAYMADAAVEGRSLRKDKSESEQGEGEAKPARRRRAEAPAEELSDAELLGAATLAKVAEKQVKEAAEAEAKAVKDAEKAQKAAETPETAKVPVPAKRAVTKKAAPKTRKAKTKIRKKDLEGAGEGPEE
jgi:small subunit ribosomal protein S2